jgi:uncharacterized protein (TIGR02246 family)
MRKLVFTALGGFACAAAVWAATAAAPAAGKASAEQAIQRTEREFVAAWNAHDPKKMAAFWEADGDLINPVGRHAKGRAEIEALLTEEQSTVFKNSTYTIDSEVIRMLTPTLAVSDWESTVTGVTTPEGQPAPPFKHHVTCVLRNTKGEWRVVTARPVQYPPGPTGAPAH